MPGRGGAGGQPVYATFTEPYNGAGGGGGGSRGFYAFKIQMNKKTLTIVWYRIVLLWQCDVNMDIVIDTDLNIDILII